MKKIVFLFTYTVLYAAQMKAQNIQPDINPVTGGIGQKLVLTGSGFGNTRGNSYVSFFQENSQYYTAAAATRFRYISWSDTRIEMEMPVAYSNRVKVVVNGVERYSPDTLHVMANLGYRTVNPLDYEHLYNMNRKGGYAWRIHRTFWENPAARSAIEDVFRDLRCRTGINFTLIPGPSDAVSSLNDTINQIGPDNNLTVAGINDRLWSSCILGQDTFFVIANQDIRISSTIDWYYGTGSAPAGKGKFRYVLQHELGHALGLSHVNELGQTMYPSVTNLPSSGWNSRDTMTNDELDAIVHFVNVCRNFTFRACNITPLQTIVNCSNVYEMLSSSPQIARINPEVYPNPAANELTVAGLQEMCPYIITDLNGKILRTGNINRHESIIRLDGLPSGVYFLIGNGSSATWRCKVIRQ